MAFQSKARVLRNPNQAPGTVSPVLFAAAVCLSAGAVGACAGIAGDTVLLAVGLSNVCLLCLSNALAGMLFGALCLQIKLRRKERRAVLADRSYKIEEMNHVVRNAVSILAFYGRRSPDTNAPLAVANAVKRIDWALREVLPKGWNAETVAAPDR